MTTDNTLAVRAALESGADAAETQLALIASNAGDSQLQLVVETLTAAEINVIVADSDMAKPSIAHAFITPAQFLEAFDRLGSRWSRFDQVESAADYLEVQEIVEDFLCPMVLSAEDPKRAKQMLGTLFGHPLGCDAVLFTAIDRKDYQEFLAAPGDHSIIRGTWQELLQSTLEHHPRKYAEIKDLAAAIQEDGEKGILSFVTTFLNEMHEEASKYHGPVGVVSEDFVDI